MAAAKKKFTYSLKNNPAITTITVQFAGTLEVRADELPYLKNVFESWGVEASDYGAKIISLEANQV